MNRDRWLALRNLYQSVTMRPMPRGKEEEAERVVRERLGDEEFERLMSLQTRHPGTRRGPINGAG